MSKLLKQLNDNQNKVADTNGIMKLQAWDYGVVQDLTNKKITATVANASGFLFDLDLVSNGTEIDLDFKDSQLQKLTPDTYFLEIKVTDEDGDISVFPTEGYATFTINKNLHATEGALVPQITFDTVLADVKKAMDEKVADYVKTIAKGDKGDKGDPGKDAEMPVIGGRNYVQNSSGLNGSSTVRPTLMGASSSVTNASITYQSDGILMTNGATNTTTAWYYEVANPWANFSDTPLTPGKPITFSVDIMGTIPQVVIRCGFNGGTGGNPYFKTRDINNTSWTRVSITVTSNSTNTGLFFRIQASNNNQFVNGWSGGETLKFRYVKIEEGNVATDWTPAPEDTDNRYVNKSGDTMTGGLKGGHINLPASGDLNTLTDTGKYYQTTSANTANWVNRPSNAPSLAFSVDVIGQANQSLITQVYYVHTTSRVWVRTMWLVGKNMTASQWAELANDNNVVHNAGNESIAGDKKFSGKITVDNASKYPLNSSVPLASMNMLYGTISAIRVGNLVQATYNKPNSTDKVPVKTTSLESIPADFRPLAGVKGAGTDSSGGTVDITLNPDGTLTTGNTYIDSGKSATITFTYPVL